MIDVMGISSAWLLLPAGACAGVLAGLFGVGGGIIVVPTVFYFLTHTGVSPVDAMPIAVCTSLCSIIPTSASSALSHFRLGHIDKQIVRLWIFPLLIGVGLGAFVVSFVKTTAFSAIFGGMLLMVALHKIFLQDQAQRVRKALWLHYPAAGAVGFLSALAGVGGGATGVPLLTYLGWSMHKAIGTCSVFGFLIAFPGALLVLLLSQTPENAPYGMFRLLYWPALLFLLPATITFAPLGAWLSSKLSGRFLHYVFLLVLLTVGSRMLLHGLFSAQ